MGVHVKYRRLGRLWIVSLAGLAVMAIGSVWANRQIVINTSPSVRPGLYIRSWEPLHVGAIVDFRIPATARAYVRARTGKNGDVWYILKPIAAGPGDRVDTTGKWLVINGRHIAPMPPQNYGDGHPLPIWRDSRVLGANEFFVFSNRIPNSFDSRSYGPICRTQIETVRIPLITW